MKIGEKAGLLFGHVICICVLIICHVETEHLFFEQKNETDISVPTTQEVTQTPIPTKELLQAEITKVLQITEIPMPTELPIPTETPVPSETPVSKENPEVTPYLTEVPAESESLQQEQTREDVLRQVMKNIEDGVYTQLDNKMDNWWFYRRLNQEPSGSGELFDIGEYRGMYRNKQTDTEDKVIYITMDCGYGSSFTTKFLDIFKKHDIHVTFFITNYFIEANPKEAKRMVEEGHLVGNHSVTHAELPSCTDEEIYEEIIGCEQAFYEATGYSIDLYFRPPEGAYSKRTMQLTKDLGYHTVFWSIAYKDYDIANQPGKEYVLDHFKTYHHNGAIALMHNDSLSNLEAIEEVILFLKENGYRFGTLDEIQ